jgi:hypothetical protein
MAAPTTPEEAIEQGALGPQSVTVDGNNVTARPLSELIEADKYLASKSAASAGNGLFGMRVRQAVPPGGG